MSPRITRMAIVASAAVTVAVVHFARDRPRPEAVRERAATEPAPAPASAPPPPASPATEITRARAPSRDEQKPVDDEAAVTARARDILRSDPEGALAILDAADRAHPDGTHAEERAAMRVDALVFARRIGPARDAAEVYLARYPRGPQAQRIEMLTGVHPRPTEPAN